jgi:hypothetical protein
MLPVFYWVGTWTTAEGERVPTAKADRPAANGPASRANSAADKKKNEANQEKADAIELLGANVACYVCHQTFLTEELSNVHKAAKVGCTKCHGLSAAHANDENIGATKPDITFRRDQVDAACIKCHKEHDVLPAKVVGRFVARKLPPQPDPICTDCHGTHRIKRSKSPAGPPPEKKPDQPLPGSESQK